MINQNPSNVIKIDKNTNMIDTPTLLLMSRSLDNIYGKISRYEDWNISLSANGMDEISFTVPKYYDGILCPVWDDLIDLRVVNIRNFGNYEVKVDYTDNTKTSKSVHGVSLETELEQYILNDFHVNDEDAMTMKITKYNEDDFDEKGSFIPTVFYNPNDVKHSLLHRVLAEKAPHWKLGYITPYITMSEEDKPEESNKFQRTYTADGISIYDFLTNTVAKESNVIFVFDTLTRTINCYSQCDCIDQDTHEILANGIGIDTEIVVSKNKLGNEITISSDKDKIKNCYRIEGGDDLISDMVRVVNMNGSNYIYEFGNFQYDDMPTELRDKLLSYKDMISSQGLQDEYYGENGIYTRLIKAYDDLVLYESLMMPDTSLEETTAQEQYEKLVNQLSSSTVAVSSYNNYNDNLFIGVTNNIIAYASIIVDSRYNVEVINEPSPNYSSKNHIWSGNIKVTRASDNTDYYPKTSEQISQKINVSISDDELMFTKQRIEKKLSEGSMLDIDFDVVEMTSQQIKDYFNQYSLNRLQSFYDGYNSCISVLTSASSSVKDNLYNTYYSRMSIVGELLEKRKEEVQNINNNIVNITNEQIQFQKDNKLNLLDYLGEDLYNILRAYIREDNYKNDNYISDGLSISDCIKEAKKLLDISKKEIKKACGLQRTVSVDLNNLLILPEFKNLYDKFSLYNYIRVKSDDELIKLRIIGIDFNGSSSEKINVTFSDKIETITKTVELQDIIKSSQLMSQNFEIVSKQSQKGYDAKAEVSEMKEGINASDTKIISDSNQEVSTTSAGIEAKLMTDEGYYDEKKLRITGNNIVLTDDDWQSIKLAIGDITVNINGKEQKLYGVSAQTLVGALIAGKQLIIGNENGTVEIDSSGISISNGVIKSANYSSTNKTGSIINLANGNFSFAGDKLKYTSSDGILSLEGKIIATSGRVGKFNIDNALYSGTNSMSSPNAGIYIGTDGIRQYKDTSQYIQMKDGALTAKNANITGTIKANNITANSSYYLCNSDDTDFKSPIKIISDTTDSSVFTTQINFGRLGKNANYISFIDDGGITEGEDARKCKLTTSRFNVKGQTLFEDEVYTNKNITCGNNIYAKKICSNSDYYVSKNSDNITILGYNSTTDYDYVGNNNIEGLVLRGKNVKLNNSSGTTVTSDERLKNSFKSLDEFNNTYMNLIPYAFKYNNGTSDRYHFGFKAQDVKIALEKNGYTTQDFGGVVQMTASSDDEEYQGIEDPMGLRYNEFIAWNTHMIQKLYKKVELQEQTINELKLKIDELKISNSSIQSDTL